MTSVLYDVPGPKARRVSLIGSVVGTVLILGLLAFIIMTLAQQGIFEGRRWAIFTRGDVWMLLGNGIGATLSAAAIAAVIAFPLGLMLCLLRISLVAWIRIPTRVVLEFLRGMPVVLMMLFVLLVFGTSSFVAVIAGLVLYNAAIFAEIIRAGIQSLPKGQREAGLTIGLTSFQSRMLDRTAAGCAPDDAVAGCPAGGAPEGHLAGLHRGVRRTPSRGPGDGGLPG